MGPHLLIDNEVADWYTLPADRHDTQIADGTPAWALVSALEATTNVVGSIGSRFAPGAKDIDLLITQRLLNRKGLHFHRIITHAAQAAPDLSTLSSSDSATVVIRELERRLNLPLQAVLKAAGIRPRTFYSWEKRPEITPHVSSLGRLWSLLQCVQDLVEILGGQLGWLRADQTRVEMLTRGRFDELTDAAFASIRRTLQAPLLYAGDDSIVIEIPKVPDSYPVRSATPAKW